MSETVPVSPAPETLRARVVRLVTSAGALALAGVVVLAVGFTLGWVSATHLVVANAEVAAPEVIEVPVSSLSDETLMPDVRGLDPAAAMQVLADAGVDVALVQMSEKLAAGEGGLIIEQTPAFGTPRPTDIQLFVSAAATVPALVGTAEQDALVALRELQARVDRVGVYRPGEPVGVVVALDPPAGAPLPAGVTLTVTEAPASVRFAELDPSGSCSSRGTIEFDGQEWQSGVVCSSSSSGRTGSWVIDQAVDVVAGTVGVLDGAASDAAVRVEILADEVVVQSFDLTARMSRQFEFVASGVSTLSVRVTTLSSGAVSIGIGEFTGLGTASKIDGLIQ